MPYKINPNDCCPSCLSEGKPASRIYEGGLCHVHFMGQSAAAKALAKFEEAFAADWEMPEWKPAPPSRRPEKTRVFRAVYTDWKPDGDEISLVLCEWVFGVPTAFVPRDESAGFGLMAHIAGHCQITEDDILEVVELQKDEWPKCL